MERSDLPDKLFAEDTLSFPNSVDGERPTAEEARASARDNARGGGTPDGPEEDMLAVEYREDEVRTGTTDGEDAAPPAHAKRAP